MIPRQAKNPMQNTKHRTGFTLVEVLLAVAIGGMLLAAVAVAFSAAAVNCRENEEMFKTINNARQALLRMSSQLRTANAVNPAAPSNECSLITAAGQDITYRYNSTDKKLYLITNDDLTDSDYVLCDNVAAMTCAKNVVVEEAVTKVMSVEVTLTVCNGDMQRTICGAAAIRRNLK